MFTEDFLFYRCLTSQYPLALVFWQRGIYLEKYDDVCLTQLGVLRLYQPHTAEGLFHC